MQLGKIAAKGAAFLAALTFIKKILGLVRSVVLARILIPEDFGLIALALVLIQGMNSLTSVGVDKYLIQKKTIDDSIVGNIWLLNIFRGMLLTLLALIVCPFYSRLLQELATLPVLLIVAFTPLMEGLKNPSSILAEREIRFGRISIYETICAILEVTVVVLMAWFIRDAEALAWGFLFGTFLNSLLSYFFFPSPKFPKLDLSIQLEILSVGKHFVVISVGTLIMVQGDNLIVGAFNGTEQLGLYVIAYQLAEFPVVILSDIANRVALPVFSSLQFNKERLQSVLIDVIQIQMAIIIPFVIAVTAFASELITTLYGNKWIESGTVLKALMFVTLGKGITHVCVPYIFGIGAFSFASRMKCVETLIFLISVSIGAWYFGLIGAALGAGTGYITAGIGRLIFMCRDANLSFFRIIKYLLFPSIAVLPGVFIAKFATDLVIWHKIIETTIIMLIVCVSYAGVSFFLQKKIVDTFFKKVLSKCR